MSHEIDGVRKEEDRLTATQPPHTEKERTAAECPAVNLRSSSHFFFLGQAYLSIYYYVILTKRKKKEKLRTGPLHIFCSSTNLYGRVLISFSFLCFPAIIICEMTENILLSLLFYFSVRSGRKFLYYLLFIDEA
jgi:hypothetical protein